MEQILDVGLIIVFSLLGSVVASKYRFPPVAGLLLAGAVVGANGLNLVHSGQVISALSEIGAILLLFAIGIEFSLKHILKHSLRAFMVGIFKMGIVFLLSHAMAMALGLGVMDAMLIAMLLSITSTAIFANFMKQREFENRAEKGLLFAVLIIEDLVGVGLLTFFASLKIEAIKTISADILVPIAVSVVVL
ncbi:hypothetical protein FJZ26_01120 [Candidatus Parvarchaeota archaeon]|nr:hypothetical protein [Candidatus Parvarchaeota archaeon]